MVRDAEVWRINTVTAPSRARASRRNFAMSAVRSVKPGPRVCTVSNDETMLVAVTADGADRVSDVMTLDLARNILLHAIGHLDQPPPGLFQKRHHTIEVAVARQRYFELALAVRDLRLGLSQ